MVAGKRNFSNYLWSGKEVLLTLIIQYHVIED